LTSFSREVEPSMETWEEKIRKKLGKTMRIEREDVAGHREGRTENVGVCSTALTTWSVGERYLGDRHIALVSTVCKQYVFAPYLRADLAR
jgi:hypothetical protein